MAHLNQGILARRKNVAHRQDFENMTDADVGGERGIRKLKIKQKISGTFRSDKGADAFMAVHSIADTAWKNKQSPFEAILALY